jgi:long-chain acyl-CoA synthetase
VPGVEVEVRGEAGEAGELWIRGPNIMLDYWNRPEATAEALVDGWYRSGDIVSADEHGYLYLVDRAQDMIITGGENVYSLEIEAVHAVVTTRVAVTADALLDHCREHIAGFKVPREIELRTEPLPKSAPGKVLKTQLREPFWASRDRRAS